MQQLKCPSCKQQSAWLSYGFSEKIGRRHKQKLCVCGYEGKRTYWGRTMTFEEYRQQMKEKYERIEAQQGKTQ